MAEKLSEAMRLALSNIRKVWRKAKPDERPHIEDDVDFLSMELAREYQPLDNREIDLVAKKYEKRMRAMKGKYEKSAIACKEKTDTSIEMMNCLLGEMKKDAERKKKTAPEAGK
jgi:hypothetical protein|tara:strand:- start:1061 stop:1402 length:342 start_codon:yes stop_codon:yes gene_type:complete